MNTRNPGDDFSETETHVEGDRRGMTSAESNAMDERAMSADDDAGFEGDGETPLHDTALEGSGDAVETGIFNTGSGSTGNPILDMSIGTTAGVTPSIDTLIGEEEGDGYTEPDDDDEEKDD